MGPSERINYIREIARRLSAEDWPVIDLTLRQFGLMTQNAWSGDKSGYVIEMISGAADITLTELGEHLGYSYGTKVSSIEPSFWHPGRFRVFISHLSNNKTFAAELQKEFENLNITAFVAHNDIVPTREWEDEILLALSTCDAMVAVLDPQFHESSWTDQEVGFALGKGILVITVQKGLTPYGFMARFQAVNGANGETKDIAEEIMRQFLTHKQTTRRFTQTLVAALESSGSFAESRRTIGLIERVQYMDQSLLERMEAAVEHNSQVSDSWGVPARIKAVRDKWMENGASPVHDTDQIDIL
jgi:hypothetical protein